MMSQAAFSRYIGVSRKTVTTMKKLGEIVMVGDKVDEKKSLKKLKSLGRKFGEDNKLIKETSHASKKINTVKPINLLSDEVVPESNLSNMSVDEKEERVRLLEEATALRKEVEKKESSKDIDHDLEIGKLDLTDARLIKEYWTGVSLRQKAELASEELIYKKDVDAAQFVLAREVREKISSRPKIAFKMVGKNIQEIEKILEEEAEEIFEILVGTHVS